MVYYVSKLQKQELLWAQIESLQRCIIDELRKQQSSSNRDEASAREDSIPHPDDLSSPPHAAVASHTLSKLMIYEIGTACTVADYRMSALYSQPADHQFGHLSSFIDAAQPPKTYDVSTSITGTDEWIQCEPSQELASPRNGFEGDDHDVLKPRARPLKDISTETEDIRTTGVCTSPIVTLYQGRNNHPQDSNAAEAEQIGIASTTPLKVELALL
ncbi:MAG: hypothetical protein Q9181_006959 [Wetmoreana brouardii]